MLDQYYKFLANRLLDWLSNRNDIKKGNKYFLLLEDELEAEKFYDNIISISHIKKTDFYSPTYDYSTVAISVNGEKVLFVAPVKGITQDFLVTVRNRVNENTNEWQNTSVFFIVYSSLDSIVKGSFDMRQKGAPFNTESIKEDLYLIIESSSILTDQEKQILMNYLVNISSNPYIGMQDYEVIFSILYKRSLSDSDYLKLGYFYDSSLATFERKDEYINRLQENKKAFDQIENIHSITTDYEEIKERLRDEYEGESLLNKLSKEDDWKEADFKEVVAGKEKLKVKLGSKIEISDSFLDNLDETNCWGRKEGTTRVKRKKIHMLFSKEYFKDNEKITIQFTENINKTSFVQNNSFIINSRSELVEIEEIEVRNRNLTIHLGDIDFDQTYGGKITYTHNKNSRFKFEIYFMLVPFNLEEIKKVQPNFRIKIHKTNKKFFFDISNEIPTYEFGPNPENTIEVSYISNTNSFDLYNYKIEVSDLDEFYYNGSSDFYLQTSYKSKWFPISLSDIIEKPIPSSAITIEKIRLSSKNQLVFEDEKITTGSKVISINNSYKENLFVEEKLVNSKFLCGEVADTEFRGIDLDIPQNLQVLYFKLLLFYGQEKTLPSLAINNYEHLALLKAIENEVSKILDLEQNNQPISSQSRDILKIGVVLKADSIIFTPLHPLLVSYEIEKQKQLLNSPDIPFEQVISTLNAQYLVPYLKINDIQYRSNYSKTIPRWLIYKKLKDRSISDLGKNIIFQRMCDYRSQFSYLFESDENISLNISAINISDQDSFFEAIVKYILNRIKKTSSLDKINPINIYFDKTSYGLESLFSILYEIKYLDRLEEVLKIKLTNNKNKNGELYNDYEVLDTLQNKISVYQLNNFTRENLETNFHISFYQAQELHEVNINKNNNLQKNYALNGLLNYPQFTKVGDKYANGFGISNSNETSSKLVKMVVKLNSLFASLNKDVIIYHESNTLVNYIPSLNYSILKPIVKTSNWVTFLNLDVDLSYFFDESNGEMLVIHYTDQTTTSKYESVTVTNKISQYEKLLKDVLPIRFTKDDEFNSKEIIRNFNIINGQWLLNLISYSGNKNKNYLREKLSIISAYKTLLGLLNHKNFIWIPISLEEILRVSGMVGLKSKEGLFSAKNLGQTGQTSDDLLFLGIEQVTENNKQKVLLHFLPVEVKVGLNSTVNAKAKKQVLKTSEILNKYLNDNSSNPFMMKYYLNFFISIAMTNLEKMITSGFYNDISDKEYNSLRDYFAVGNYKTSNSLQKIYGKGIIFKFTIGRSFRTLRLDKQSEICYIDVPESDAYNIVSKPIEQFINKIQSGKYDFSENILLANRYDSTNIDLIEKAGVESSLATVASTNDLDDDLDDDSERIGKNSSSYELSNARILIGTHKYSNNKIYWEYGHPKLSNRHVVITGKSGQGKTYFIQTLLSELSKFNINSLIIDYTDGFLENHLEEIFINNYQEKLKTKIIYLDKLPINPFKRQTISIGNKEIPETVEDMIDRVVQSIDFVFTLGVQQTTTLAEAIKEDIENFGENYTFTILSDNLKSLKDNSKLNLHGRIRSLVEQDRFSYDSDFNWNNVFSNNGEVHIFQFSGLQKNIQQIMIEFLLWDIFQYAKSGSESKPLPIVLDEIQNLRFSSDSPIVKILREGRKYGLSGIFATQSLTSIKGTDTEAIYNTAEQIHFLPTDNQVTEISKRITTNKSDRDRVEVELKDLKKGEAVAYGPILDKNLNLTAQELYCVKVDSFESRLKQ